MRSRLPMLRVAVCAALLAGIGALWLRGLFVNDELHLNLHGHLCIVGSFPNHLNVILYRAADDAGPAVAWRPAAKHLSSMPIFWQPRYETGATSRQLSVPWWMPALFLVAALAWRTVAPLRRRRREARGVCVTCGYDLRASGERCPECGSVVAK